MTERTARTGARFAREKQVPRCARNDSQKSKSKSKSKGRGKSKGKSIYRNMAHTPIEKRQNNTTEVYLIQGIASKQQIPGGNDRQKDEGKSEQRQRQEQNAGISPLRRAKTARLRSR
jgi:hypothetical protein